MVLVHGARHISEITCGEAAVARLREDEHLGELPAADQRSRAILQKMREDEMRHGIEAREAGGRPLPQPVRELMQRVSKLMKFGAYRF